LQERGVACTAGHNPNVFLSGFRVVIVVFILASAKRNQRLDGRAEIKILRTQRMEQGYF
jgi:hypothetical protein